MSKKINLVMKIFSSVLVFLVVVLAGIISVPKLFGLHIYTVLSPSMEPEYKTGALIYVKPVDSEDIETGDVITFLLSEETTATHRVVEIVPDENDPDTLFFRTKGDANKVEDASPVHEANVIGTPVFNIPYMGYVASFIQNPPGMYLSIAIGLIIVILVFMMDILTSDKEEENKNTNVKE